MNFDIDGGKLLYVLGVLFALGALLYFVRDVVFGLSITVTAALLFVVFVAFLVAGLTVDRDALDVVAYAVSALSYAVFLGYVVTRYAPDETGVFLLLAASSVLFVGLGYGVRQGRLAVNRHTAGYVVVGLLALSLVLVGADVVTGDVRYTADLDETTTVSIAEEIPDGERTRVGADVGSLIVANPSPFSRPGDPPTAWGCVVGTDIATQEIPIRYEPRSYDTADRIAGGEDRTHDLEAQLLLEANETDERTFAIERGTDCDVTRDEPTIVVVFEDEPVDAA